MPHSATVSDDRALDRDDQSAHAETEPRQVEQRIDDELAWAVIGHLTAAIDVHHRDVAGREQVLRSRVHPHCEHRRMLQEPELVGRRRIARVDVPLHRVPG